MKKKMTKEPLVFKVDKVAQKRLKKSPKVKEVIINEPYQKTAYTEGVRRNHKPMKKTKAVPADKKVGKTKYE